ncbi:MAG: ABC transporter permease [Halobacteriaceae archaeon]
MSNRLTLALQELRSLRNEKTIILAILIQVVIASFSSFLVVGLVALYNPSASTGGFSVNIGITGNASSQIAPAILESKTRNAIFYPNRSVALQEFRKGVVDTVLIATKTATGRLRITAFVPEGSFRTTIIVVELQEVFAIIERNQRLAASEYLKSELIPLPTKIESNPYFSFVYTILLPLLMFLPVFISGSIITDTITEEIERGTLELLAVSPVTDIEIIEGKAITPAGLVPIQVLVWIALLTLNEIQIANPIAITAYVTSLGIVAVTLGATLGLTIRNRQRAQLMYSFAILFLFGIATLAPESPGNIIAKLALNTATVTTWISVVITLIVPIVGLLSLRMYIDQSI